jgi:hypothetical protein
MRKTVMVLAPVLLFGCGPASRGPGAPGGPGGGNYGQGTFGATCNGSHTVLTGVALAPNGIDPVPGAHVYVVDQPAAYTPHVGCDICDRPVDHALADSSSGGDGRFSLSLDMLPQSGSVKLVVAKGRFRRVTTVNVTACMSAAAPAAALTLPGSSRDGDIPKIAVASGSSDHLDVVLDALGVREFDCFVGTKNPPRTGTNTPCASATEDVSALLGDPTRLSQYNMLFISCAPGKFASLSNSGSAVSNLEAWTKAGGRLFATDESYNWIEQAFPSFIEFYPGTSTPTAAQPVDQANLGVGASSTHGGASYPGTVVDTDLETWLQTVNAVPPEANTLTLSGFLNPWSAQKDVSMDVRTMVTATASYYTTSSTTVGSPSTSATMPMTVEWDYNMCGRVLFSSYHTLSSTMQGAQLSPQEKILEYLMLDVGSCVGPIG